jgi:hypothetical protein
MSTGTVTASQLNFRSSPNGPVIAKLPKGASVEILEQQGEWLKVLVGEQVGFVSANFVHQQQDAPPPHEDPAAATAAAPTSTSGTAAAPAPVAGVCKFVGDKAVAPDGTVFAKKFKLGVFNFGKTAIGQFVRANPALFAGVAPSRLRVMQAVSENEGKLEAINTWDNAFLTFGCFQWIVGVDSGLGELPAMINRLKQSSPAAFQTYFGQFGLDVTGVVSPPGSPPCGFFTLNGIKLQTPQQKEKLRTLDWAYRFWLSGQDAAVRQAQIGHAMGRVDLFYRSPQKMIRGRFVADYVSSEFGVALLLDQHVNRPGHVPGTLARAVDKFAAQLGSDNPAGWGDAQERKLLDIYIQLRASTSMTDSDKRANTIRQAVANGLASDKRGSYQP